MAAFVGGILGLASIAIFLWAVIGVVSPRIARLAGRAQAVGLWVVSVVVAFASASILPEEPPTSPGRQAQTSRTADEQARQVHAPPTPPEEPQISAVTFSEVNDKFGLESNLTDIQKEREWEAYEGLCVEWTGELTNLSEGLFGGFNIGFRHLPTTLTSDVYATAPDSAEERLLTMRQGASYTYRATLVDYGALLGIRVELGCN